MPDSNPPAAHEAPVAAPRPPNFLFMAGVSATALLADAVTKYWAETTLAARPPGQPSIVLVDDVLAFQLAYNRGGAFGMLSTGDEAWRGPFFLLVSCAAVAFIVSLYRRVAPQQWALRWGLPLVLGGALGNLADRIAKGKVVDFVDYQAGWVQTMNELIKKVNDGWHVTDHWPTFNVADMCICAGVALMAIDMFSTSRGSLETPAAEKARGGAAS
jgi:signal peptidase II